jgi:hypothetical protein
MMLAQRVLAVNLARLNQARSIISISSIIRGRAFVEETQNGYFILPFAMRMGNNSIYV